jgi:hypothetical protein
LTEQSTVTEQQVDQRHRERRMWVGVILVYAALLTLDLWIYFALPTGPWLTRFGFVFQVIGVFGLATGFLAATEISKRLSSLLEDLTAPNLRQFVAGNFALTAIVMIVMSVLFRGVFLSKRWYTALPLALVYLVSLPFVFLLVLAYFVLVVPVVYIANAVVSTPLTTISNSRDEITITRGEERIDIRAVIVEHRTALRGFLIGVASTLFAVLAKALDTF